ncbi:MAG: heme ABC transporter permease CcmC [Bacteroidota bacterium]
MIRFLYKLGSPKWFYGISTTYLPWVVAITGSFLLIGIAWSLAFSPADYRMGDSFRVIHVHVPAAGLMKGCYYFIALMSAAVLIWDIKMADIAAKASAPIGAMATALTLATGSIWGAPSWGTWWTWDARLTSTLIMLFIYMGIMALRAAMEAENKSKSAARACAVLALVGVINVPIIEYSVEWWNTLHQPASSLSASGSAPNPPEMWVPSVITGVGMIGFFVLALTLRVRNEILIREQKTGWVKALVTGN